MIAAILETPIGQALRIYWDDLPLWALGNILAAISLLPSAVIWMLGNQSLAIAFSFPVALVLAGLASLLVKPIAHAAPHWSDLRRGNYQVALSAWLAIALVAESFAIPGLLFQCLLAALVLLLAPIVLCLPTLYPANIQRSWRNALIIAVHFPFVALGLPALALIFAWLTIMTKGALLLALPSLWLAIALVSLQEIVTQLTG